MLSSIQPLSFPRGEGLPTVPGFRLHVGYTAGEKSEVLGKTGECVYVTRRKDAADLGRVPARVKIHRHQVVLAKLTYLTSACSGPSQKKLGRRLSQAVC
jgi:hypothetical protein